MYKVTKKIIRILFAIIIIMSLTSGTMMSQVTAQAAAKIPYVTKSNVTLYINYKSYQIRLCDLEKSAQIIYKSSNANYAKVSKKGVITPIAAGKAAITVMVKQDRKTYSLQVLVTVKNPSITLITKTSHLGITDSFTYKAKTYGTSTKVVWSVSDNSIGTIDSQGNFTPKSFGEVIVSATAGELTAECLVTVDPMWTSASEKERIEQCGSAVVEVEATTFGLPSTHNIGNGFFIGPGVLVTEYAAIKGADKISVYPEKDNVDDSYYSIESILGYDESIDMAILKVNDLTDNPVLPLAKAIPEIGDTVYTIDLSSENTGARLYGAGTIAKIGVDENGNSYAQMEFPEQFLTSGGGPILNEAGEVVGINPGFFNTWVSDEDYYFLVDGLKKINTDRPISPNLHTQTPTEATVGSVNGSDNVNERLYIPSATFSAGIVLPNTVRYYWIRMEQDGTMAALVQPYVTEELTDITVCLYDESGNEIEPALVDENDQEQIILLWLAAGDYYISIIPNEDYTGLGITYGFEWDCVY